MREKIASRAPPSTRPRPPPAPPPHADGYRIQYAATDLGRASTARDLHGRPPPPS